MHLKSRMHRYAAHNYKHIWNAVKGLELGRPQLLGEAMNDSQSLFDDCAIEVGMFCICSLNV